MSTQQQQQQINNTYRQLSITELNDTPYGQPLKELVSGDLRIIIEDEYIETLCAFSSSVDDYYPIFSTTPIDDNNSNDDWHTWDDTKILQTHATDGEQYVQNFPTSTEHTYSPCSIHLIEDDYGEYYTIRMISSSTTEQLPWEITNVPRFITGYPKESIRYFYRQYKSDMHLDGTFRRHIDIDDSIFPEVWKNRKSTSSVI
jgi:hypothetical protein